MVRIPFLTVHFLLCHTFLNLHKNINNELSNAMISKHVNPIYTWRLASRNKADAVKILINASTKVTWRFMIGLNPLLETYKDNSFIFM